MILVKSARCRKHSSCLKLYSNIHGFYHAHLFQKIDMNVSLDAELATKILISDQDKFFWSEDK